MCWRDDIEEWRTCLTCRQEYFGTLDHPGCPGFIKPREPTGIVQPGPLHEVKPREPKVLEILELKDNGGVFSGELVARDVTFTVRNGDRVYDMTVHVTRMHARSVSFWGEQNKPYSFECYAQTATRTRFHGTFAFRPISEQKGTLTEKL